MALLRYRLTATDPAAHLFEVQLQIEQPDPEGQVVALPAWIPGSYMIREFARHIVQIEARCGRRSVALEKIDKHSWRAAPCRGALTITARVYAWDLSVRGAHLDRDHGFVNGTSVFLRVLGQEDAPVEVELVPPRDDSCADWQVATTLPRDGAPSGGFGRYRAADHDELIDHPIEMGRFTRVKFEACGVPHEVVVTGIHDLDGERLARDLQAVCEAQIRLFEPRTRRAPFERYLFLTMAVGEGYGGLEHRASTALLCGRLDLPYKGMKGLPEGYRTFLGLASHEYFHSWHVKRIKPQVFARYDLDRENYTRLLWIFEGFTSYYDDLMLVRSGVIGVGDYLKALGQGFSQVLRGPGRHVQSVAESSFDAWVKYYRQDENSPNTVVSYYAKGALVALCLDLALRKRTGGKRSLDDVMRLMWARFGRDFAQARTGLGEDAFPRLVEEATGEAMDREIAEWTEGTADLPVAELLHWAGIATHCKAPDDGAPWLGIRTAQRGAELIATTVLNNGPAHHAGLASGDQLLALDGLRLDERRLRSYLARRRVGDQVTLHTFRRDELRSVTVTLAEPPDTEVTLSLGETLSAEMRTRQASWLGTRKLRRTAATAARRGPRRA